MGLEETRNATLARHQIEASHSMPFASKLFDPALDDIAVRLRLIAGPATGQLPVNTVTEVSAPVLN